MKTIPCSKNRAYLAIVIVIMRVRPQITMLRRRNSDGNLEVIQKLLTAIVIVLSFILGLMISYGIYFQIDKSLSDNRSDDKKSKLSDYSAVCFRVPPSIVRTWFTMGSTYSIDAGKYITDDQGVPWSIYLHGSKPKEGLIVTLGSYDFVLIKKEGK